MRKKASKNAKKSAWNKGVTVGQRKAFTHKQVVKIRTFLYGGNEWKDIRDAALFNTAIDTMLHASDLLSMRVSDVLVKGVVADNITVKSASLGRSIKCSLSDNTARALAEWIALTDKKRKEYIFTGRHATKSNITPRQYSRLVKQWAAAIGLDPTDYGTESLRRTRAAHIMQKTGNAEAVRELLGLSSITSVFRYIGSVSGEDSMKISRACEL